MLEAIRNLGILKMIQEFPQEFTYEALESVAKFLEQREKAIENGNYGKLQFEPIKEEAIGVFSLDGEEVTFKVIRRVDDTSKYIFRKPPGARAAYISPTWKGSDKNLSSSIEYFEKWCNNPTISGNAKGVFSKLVHIFENKTIKVVDSDGRLTQRDFWDIYHEKKQSVGNKKGLNVFTAMIDDKYPGEVREIVEYALNQIAEGFYTITGIAPKEGKCSLCHCKADLFPNVLRGVDINIANVDKPGFFPGVTIKNSLKAFPMCAPCAEALYVAKFHVFPSLRQTISGHQTLIIPHLVQSEVKAEGLEIITEALKLLKKDIKSAKGTEAGIIEDLGDNRGVDTVSFLFGKVGGQSIQNIRKFVPEVLPSRLSRIAQAIHEINNKHDRYPEGHPWRLKIHPLSGRLQIIRNVLGKAKYDDMPTKGKRPPFKASTVQTLDLLEAIFMKKQYGLKCLLPEFSAKLSYDFLGSLSNEKQDPVFVIRDNIAHMVYLLKFLDKVEVIQMADNIDLVKKYLEGSKGLEALNKFLSEEAVGLDNAEKQYTFLVGLLFGKLIAFQQARRVSNNALKWLKGLEIGSQDLMEIFRKTRSKIDDYSFQRPAWSEEMKGVAEAIGALGSQIGSNFSISRREVPYYFCLGQSLSGYYLPGKGDDNKSADDKGGK